MWIERRLTPKITEAFSNRALNFAKVAPLFKDKPVKAVVMANIPESTVIHLSGYDIVNPLRCDYCFS